MLNKTFECVVKPKVQRFKQKLSDLVLLINFLPCSSYSANIEITRVRKSNESEIAVMKAALKKEQTKTASLEMSLQQKVCGSELFEKGCWLCLKQFLIECCKTKTKVNHSSQSQEMQTIQ